MKLKSGTMPKNTVPLTLRISPEARKRLDEVASRIVGSEERLPLGRIIDAMVLWFFGSSTKTNGKILFWKYERT